MILGLDIASYQGNPNFDEVKASGRAFVMTKITEGLSYVNPTAARNRSESHRLAMGTGLYHYADGNDPVLEANHFVGACGDLVTGEVLMLDFEIGLQDPVGYCKAFLDRVQQLTGVKALIYLNQSLNNEYDWSPVVSADYGLVIADYDNNVNTVPNTDWKVVAMKQYTSTGQVPGIVGNVDLDSFFGADVAVFARYGKQGGLPTPPPAPTPVPAPQPAPSSYYIVRAGDTLSAIAAAHGLTLAQIEALNPNITNPNLITIGERINLGGGVTPQGRTYTVRSGDTMSKIAGMFGESLAHLEAINPRITNPNMIFVGQIINV